MEEPTAQKKPDQSFKAYVIRQFKKNKLALFSFYFASFLALVALFADFLANEKPIAAKYKGEVIFPLFKQYAIDLGFSQWGVEFQNVKWRDLEYDFVVWPLVPYLPQNLDFANAQYTSPTADQRVKSKRWWHWLGTDHIGRDVLAGMIHGTRIAFLVGMISMGIAAFIGIIMGSLAGYFGITACACRGSELGSI